VNVIDRTTGFSALHFAAFNGNAYIVELLIRRGSNINLATEKQGFTPLHLVCFIFFEK
jgi:ankyrin repeat protein